MPTPPEALLRIEECKKNKSTKLNLEQLILFEIPPEVYHFDWLKELNLSRNNISQIQGLEKLNELSKLNLDSNNISKIEGLEKLSKLYSLNLFGNKISKIEGLEKLC